MTEKVRLAPPQKYDPISVDPPSPPVDLAAPNSYQTYLP